MLVFCLQGSLMASKSDKQSEKVKKYKCQKDKQTLKLIAYICDECKLAFHPGCVKHHKVINSKGELVECTASYTKIDLKSGKMTTASSGEKFDGIPMELNNQQNFEQTAYDDGLNRPNKRRREGDGDDRRDEEILRQLIVNSIRNEVQPLIKKIDALENEVTSLKNVIVQLQSQNVASQISEVKSNENNNNSKSYANAVQKSKSNAVIVIKPIQSDAQKNSEKNGKKQNENLSSVKSSINIKELGVGVTSVKERSNGTVIVQCKSAVDREKLQKRCVEKIGGNFNVHVPKVKKNFVKIVWIDIDDASLTDKEIVDNIIVQNNLKDFCENVEMKIVKRIVYEKKNEFSIIVETSSEMHKLLLFMEKVCLGWKQCKVVEYISLPRCFKCCGFNHYAKDCKSNITCAKCGGSHDSKQCNSEETKCANCVKKYNRLKDKTDFDVESLKHHAYNKCCPIYIELIDKQKKRECDNQ